MLYKNVDAFVHDVLTPKRFTKMETKRPASAKGKYLRAGCGFDTETTNKEHNAYRYMWQFAIGDENRTDVLIVRTKAQYMHLLDELQKYLKKEGAALLVWVANFSFEFQFMRKEVHFDHVFAVDSREVLYAIAGAIEFRDCLALSGMGGLENLAKNYTKTKKMKSRDENGKEISDLDYKKMRNSMTPMTGDELPLDTPFNEFEGTELGYCINDVVILVEWGIYCFNQYPAKIPLTSTGICRAAIRSRISKEERKQLYSQIKVLYPKTHGAYNFIMDYLFRGGLTHANAFFVGDDVENVVGFDFTSSYPASLLHYGYPITRFYQKITTTQTDGKYITDEKFLSGKNCWWIVARFYNIRNRTMHSIESKHKIIREEGARYDNGRLICADFIEVALTDVDYYTYCDFYEWDRIELGRVFYAGKGELPHYLIDALKDAYYTKCDLKRRGLDDTIEYKNAKALLNAFYGCCVTRLAFDEYEYKDGDITKVENAQEYYMLVKDSVLSPYWGIWCTAYSRRNLAKALFAIDNNLQENNVIYYDTDSLYCVDSPRVREAIAKYNEEIYSMNAELPELFHDIGAFDPVGLKAKDENGKKVTEYVFKFKTLGAKRYLKQSAHGIEVTVAGMRKTAYIEYLKKKFGDKWEKYLFELFDDGIIMDVDIADKRASSYNDEPHSDYITDEYGNTERMEELTSIGIFDIPFSLKMQDVYLLYVEDVHKHMRKDLI